MPDNPVNNGMADDSPAAEDYQEETRIFQEELATDDHVVDPITIEQQGENDDPAQILGVPPEELKAELDKRAFSGTGEPLTDVEAGTYEGTEDDLREAVEDADEDAMSSEGGPGQ